MRRLLAVLLSLMLMFGPVPVYADSLSISAWQTGDALNSTNLNARMNSISTWANGNIANDNLDTSAGVVGSKLDLTSGTGRISQTTSVTDDAPVFTSAQTWNDASEVFSAWRLTVTNTNSASTSRMIDLRVGSTIIASISRVGQLFLNSQDYASGPRTMMDGAWFNVASATYTDNVTAASGTAPRFIAYAFQRPAVAAANSSVTTTNAATVFIASAPVAGDNMTLTNRYALWVDQGDIRTGGAIYASGSVLIGPGTVNTTALTVNGRAGSDNPLVDFAESGTRSFSFKALGSGSGQEEGPLALIGISNGTNAGRYISLGRNPDATTPAGGFLEFVEADSGSDFVWADSTGKLRINTSKPISTNDTAGTVVGDQTSWYEAKEILRRWENPEPALQAVLATDVYDFRYRESGYRDARDRPAVFTGLVGFDRDAWYLKNTGTRQVPALNDITIHGFTILSIQAMYRELQSLKSRVDAAGVP